MAFSNYAPVRFIKANANEQPQIFIFLCFRRPGLGSGDSCTFAPQLISSSSSNVLFTLIMFSPAHPSAIIWKQGPSSRLNRYFTFAGAQTLGSRPRNITILALDERLKRAFVQQVIDIQPIIKSEDSFWKSNWPCSPWEQIRVRETVIDR